MVLSGQNSKNDRYSTRMPILTFAWLFVFTIYCARFLVENLSYFIASLIVMAYIIIAFIYKTVKGD
jgi:hypothetical protein